MIGDRDGGCCGGRPWWVGDFAVLVARFGTGGGGGDDEDAGSTDSRSIKFFSLSRSRSSWPDAWEALSRSIWLRSWAPSDRRLLRKDSTFCCRLSIVSLICM